jgi:hypothetical protein
VVEEQPWKLGIAEIVYHQQSGERDTNLRKNNIVQILKSRPLINNHHQITQNMSIEQQVHQNPNSGD